MKIKQKLVPRSMTDFFCVLFVLLIIPIGYVFHLFVALPYYLGANSSQYLFHVVLSSYLLINLVGNYVAAVLIDPSIKGEVMSHGKKWKLCSTCECLVPPRTWHCDICDCCILKRDHHCNFTAGCIGYGNERYFLMFLLHLSIATMYASYFDAYYLWCTFDFYHWQNILKIVFPFAIALSGFDSSAEQMYRILCVITFIGLCASCGLLAYHFINVINGQVMYEKGKKIEEYNLGSYIDNLKIALGHKWYVTWVLPFIISPLPYDGIHWDHVKLSSLKGK